MKRRQKKSKVEVVEPVSVANRCDYCRDNGKCGRALSEMFGKLCPGRTCEDWKCEAEEENGEAYPPSETSSEGGAMRSVSSPLQNEIVAVQPEAVRTPLLHSGDTYKDRVSGQYAAIETAKDNLLRECVKFGALLMEVGYYLGESRGRGGKGGGLKGWLAENCPQINYETAMGYKKMGEMAATRIGGGSQAVAVLQDKTEVIPPGEGAPIEVESKFIEKRDNLFHEVKSRRELEQTYFKFMASASKGRQGGANKGQPGTGRRALTPVEKAEDADVEIRQLMGKIIAFDQSGKFRMMKAVAQNDVILALKDIVKSFEEQVG